MKVKGMFFDVVKITEFGFTKGFQDETQIFLAVKLSLRVAVLVL